jgi:hypothetical protein
MQRYHVPWDYMQEHWTYSQMFALYEVISESGRKKKRGKNAMEYRGYGG